MAIIDDLLGRRCAQPFNIHVRGTLGLVLLAKRRGQILQARPLVERLRRAGMYLAEDLAERALALVGE